MATDDSKEARERRRREAIADTKRVGKSRIHSETFYPQTQKENQIARGLAALARKAMKK